MRDESVIIVGQGYVGLPLAMRAVEAGYHVVGYDLDLTRIEVLRQGRSYVEDIDDDVVAGRSPAAATGRPTGWTASTASTSR